MPGCDQFQCLSCPCVIWQPCLHKKPCLFREMRSDFTTHTLLPQQALSWLCDGFREIKCKLFGEYFSPEHHEIPEVGVHGQCLPVPILSLTSPSQLPERTKDLQLSNWYFELIRAPNPTPASKFLNEPNVFIFFRNHYSTSWCPVGFEALHTVASSGPYITLVGGHDRSQSPHDLGEFSGR